MPCCNAQARRSTVVEDIDRESVQVDKLGEAIHDPGQIVERVAELIPPRHRRPTEPRQVGRDHVKAVVQTRDQVRNMWLELGKPWSNSNLGG